MSLRRGFKSWAEEQACDFRRALGLQPHEPLPARKLSAHLRICLLTPADIPDLPASVLHELLNGSSACWSALTIRAVAGNPLIISNPRHAPTRQESDLMHEIAHIICDHPPTEVGFCGMRSYNDVHEEEAKWLGASLQITRRGLLWAIGEQMANAAIADFYGASEALVRFRRNTTGVDRQVTRYLAATH